MTLNYHAALAEFRKINSERYRRLCRFLQGGVAAMWVANVEELAHATLERDIAEDFVRWRQTVDVGKITARLVNEGIYTISLPDPHYPELLKQINDPPHTLFVRGILPMAPKASLAVVGTRRASTYGKQITTELTKILAGAGVQIVSGLALGIDGVAHDAVLEAGGTTIAVLGSGIDKRTVYPAAHRRLAEEIIKAGGAIVSEYPVGFLPTQYSFPERNRIIAGLSHGTLVTEAPVESGALITAKFALEYNREVFCVPHMATSILGAGSNKYIRLGAQLVTEPEQILEIFGLTMPETIKPPIGLSAVETDLLSYITREPVPVDELVRKTNQSSALIMATLTSLEMRGLTKNIGGMRYIRN